MLLTARSGATAALSDSFATSMVPIAIVITASDTQPRYGYVQTSRHRPVTAPRFRRPSQLCLQASDDRFFSWAYFFAAASIIGRTTFWSDWIQSDMNCQVLPSH